MNGFLRTALKAALGLTAAITIVASTAAPASAANPTNYCNYDYCSVRGEGVRAGQISIDVDASGGANDALTWRLFGPNGVACWGNYTVADPPRSWVCNVSAGGYTLETYYFDHPHAYSLGLRY